MVAVACFLPGRGKDLPAPPRSTPFILCATLSPEARTLYVPWNVRTVSGFSYLLFLFTGTTDVCRICRRLWSKEVAGHDANSTSGRKGTGVRRAYDDELRQNFVKLSSKGIRNHSRLQLEAAKPMAPKTQTSSSNCTSVLHL